MDVIGMGRSNREGRGRTRVGMESEEEQLKRGAFEA